MDDVQLVRISKALADRTRLSMLRTIARRGELCCGDLARCFDVTQPTVSHHLKVLGDAGLVDTRRSGQFIQVRAVRRTLDDYRRALGQEFELV
jgi:ArsR family transcriptional regulator, arsenate/arsenite/antimonite-responsive transcriptional repressor